MINGERSTPLVPTNNQLVVADEMFDRRAKDGSDYPGNKRAKSLQVLIEHGLVQCTKFVGPVKHYYFTELGYAWYINQRPERARAKPVDEVAS